MKPPKLTHTEACKLVEDALERVGKTLAYVRLKLHGIRDGGNINFYGSRCNELRVRSTVDESNLLCNINWYGAYLSGAQAMLRAMQDHRLLNLPTIKGTKKSDAVKPAEPHDVKALVALMSESTRNLDWFLHGWPENVEVCISHERDKKGKVIGAKAKFVKKVTTIVEIKD